MCSHELNFAIMTDKRSTATFPPPSAFSLITHSFEIVNDSQLQIHIPTHTRLRSHKLELALNFFFTPHRLRLHMRVRHLHFIEIF